MSDPGFSESRRVNGSADGQPAARAHGGGADRPVGAGADPRVTERRGDEARGAGGMGEAEPARMPDAGIPPSAAVSGTKAMPGDPKPTKPASAAAVAVIAVLIIVAGFIAFPFFVFALPIALPVAGVVLLVAAIFLAAKQRRKYQRSDR